MIFWIKHNKLTIIIIITCLTIAGIQSIIIYRNNQKAILENYIQVNATITDLYRSGKGIKLSTLLIVKYNYNGLENTATIRRGGYKEGNYKKGDTIIININKGNNSIIK
jgi:amino acid permease